jgi:hypothetical protein
MSKCTKIIKKRGGGGYNTSNAVRFVFELFEISALFSASDFYTNTIVIIQDGF